MSHSSFIYKSIPFSLHEKNNISNSSYFDIFTPKPEKILHRSHIKIEFLILFFTSRSFYNSLIPVYFHETGFSPFFISSNTSEMSQDEKDDDETAKSLFLNCPTLHFLTKCTFSGEISLIGAFKLLRDRLRIDKIQELHFFHSQKLHCQEVKRKLLQPFYDEEEEANDDKDDNDESDFIDMDYCKKSIVPYLNRFSFDRCIFINQTGFLFIEALRKLPIRRDNGSLIVSCVKAFENSLHTFHYGAFMIVSPDREISNEVRRLRTHKEENIATKLDRKDIMRILLDESKTNEHSFFATLKFCFQKRPMSLETWNSYLTLLVDFLGKYEHCYRSNSDSSSPPPPPPPRPNNSDDDYDDEELENEENHDGDDKFLLSGDSDDEQEITDDYVFGPDVISFKKNLRWFFDEYAFCFLHTKDRISLSSSSNNNRKRKHLGTTTHTKDEEIAINDISNILTLVIELLSRGCFIKTGVTQKFQSLLLKSKFYRKLYLEDVVSEFGRHVKEHVDATITHENGLMTLDEKRPFVTSLHDFLGFFECFDSFQLPSGIDRNNLCQVFENLISSPTTKSPLMTKYFKELVIESANFPSTSTAAQFQQDDHDDFLSEFHPDIPLRCLDYFTKIQEICAVMFQRSPMKFLRETEIIDLWLRKIVAAEEREEFNPNVLYSIQTRSAYFKELCDCLSIHIHSSFKTRTLSQEEFIEAIIKIVIEGKLFERAAQLLFDLLSSNPDFVSDEQERQHDPTSVLFAFSEVFQINFEIQRAATARRILQLSKISSISEIRYNSNKHMGATPSGIFNGVSFKRSAIGAQLDNVVRPVWLGMVSVASMMLEQQEILLDSEKFVAAAEKGLPHQNASSSLMKVTDISSSVILARLLQPLDQLLLPRQTPISSGPFKEDLTFLLAQKYYPFVCNTERNFEEQFIELVMPNLKVDSERYGSQNGKDRTLFEERMKLMDVAEANIKELEYWLKGNENVDEETLFQELESVNYYDPFEVAN